MALSATTVLLACSATVLLVPSPGLAQAALQPRPLSDLPADLQPLVRDLLAHGFSVRIALPPQRSSYGLFHPPSRTLWLSPLSFELGIARTTFLHEATHAVQSCPRGPLTPIGWRLALSPLVEREISGLLTTAYHHGDRSLEQEAFALQAQPDAVPRLRRALAQRCPRPSAP